MALLYVVPFLFLPFTTLCDYPVIAPGSLLIYTDRDRDRDRDRDHDPDHDRDPDRDHDSDRDPDHDPDRDRDHDPDHDRDPDHFALLDCMSDLLV